jgi:hypothetical protein
MRDALKKLGYTPYHFKELGNRKNIAEKHTYCWREAMIAKLYESGKPYGKEELDKLLQRYDVGLTDTLLIQNHHKAETFCNLSRQSPTHQPSTSPTSCWQRIQTPKSCCKPAIQRNGSSPFSAPTIKSSTTLRSKSRVLLTR